MLESTCFARRNCGIGPTRQHSEQKSALLLHQSHLRAREVRTSVGFAPRGSSMLAQARQPRFWTVWCLLAA
jgi:hypothetical protein